ncbi:Interferon-induced GTP-binding Mx [Emericellopsis cladophorae]|uniref:Interferon-induced GTP-binding Mx n=1 Tax=Emericellopsis cladophorae TaxID=2686198 RepID=A0A9P9Y4E5_9HYPO|nr:Interferon-induced GTP-binding Mx [Emericellopsis cladophorae]KAI6783418.1 Interferon-induced GTP-binding Mx [Emericellopsis cladophorae]
MNGFFPDYDSHIGRLTVGVHRLDRKNVSSAFFPLRPAFGTDGTKVIVWATISPSLSANRLSWSVLPDDRLGIPALRARIQELLMSRTKSETPKRALLGKIASRMQGLLMSRTKSEIPRSSSAIQTRSIRTLTYNRAEQPSSVPFPDADEDAKMQWKRLNMKPALLIREELDLKNRAGFSSHASTPAACLSLTHSKRPDPTVKFKIQTRSIRTSRQNRANFSSQDDQLSRSDSSSKYSSYSTYFSTHGGHANESDGTTPFGFAGVPNLQSPTFSVFDEAALDTNTFMTTQPNGVPNLQSPTFSAFNEAAFGMNTFMTADGQSACPNSLDEWHDRIHHQV